jgi:hypothetical protein
MAVQIQINQGTTGTPGQAREDLVTGTAVTLVAVGGPYLAYSWSIVDKPIDIVTSTQSSALIVAPTASTTQVSPIDVGGTYLVQILVDSGSGLGALPTDVARITFYAGPTLAANPAQLPRREMAFRETTEHNVPDAVFPSGNPRGWAQERLRWQEVLKSVYGVKSFAWGRVALTSGGATLTSGVNVGVSRTGVGRVTVTLTTAAPVSTYAVVATALGAGGSVAAFNTTTATFDIERADLGGGLVDADFSFDVKVIA